MQYLIDDGKKIENKEEICEKFYLYFTSVGQNLARNIPIITTTSIKESINPKSMFLEEPIAEEINKIIQNLDSKKAYGFDNISVTAIKTVKNYPYIPILSKNLEKLMNRLSNFLESNQLLSKNQYGFRINRDTETAVIDVITDIQSNVDNK